MENVKSIFIPAQSSVSELAKAIAAALATNLGWKLDESNPSCVWDSDAHDLGVELKVNNSYVYFALKNAADTQSGNNSRTTWSSTNTYCLNIIYSANKAAVAFGMGSTPKFEVVFEGNNAILNPGSTNWFSAHRGTSGLLTFTTTVNTSSKYTSLMLLPSMYGDVFSSVYGIFSCPNTDANLIYFIGGSYYRIIGANSSSYMAFKVG